MLIIAVIKNIWMALFYKFVVLMSLLKLSDFAPKMSLWLKMPSSMCTILKFHIKVTLFFGSNYCAVSDKSKPGCPIFCINLFKHVKIIENIT